MDNKPLFSIIVPVYNVEKYLVECLESIVNQTFDDYEVLLIDDGSTDSSEKICDDYDSKYDKVYVYHKENGGLSDARNYWINKSVGEYLLFIDSDDFWNNLDFLNELSKKAQLTPKPDMIVFGYGEYKNGILYPKLLPLSSDKSNNSLEWTISNELIVSSACCKCTKADIIKNYNIYFRKGVTSEDIEWTTKLLEHCYNYATLSICVYSYRQQEQSITHNIDNNSINLLYNNIAFSLNDIDNLSDNYELILNYLAYQYITFLNLFVLFANNDYSLKNKVENLSWLLKYNKYKKVRIIYCFKRIFGMELMLNILKVFLILRKTSR